MSDMEKVYLDAFFDVLKDMDFKTPISDECLKELEDEPGFGPGGNMDILFRAFALGYEYADHNLRNAATILFE